jgi:hypothetical protein
MGGRDTRGSVVARGRPCWRRRVQPNWQPTTSDFSDAKVIKKFGGVPDDLSAL